MDEKDPHFERRHLGAISYLLGNASVFANGLIAYTKSGSHEGRSAGAGRMASAALASGTGLILARYGNTPVTQQLDRLEGNFAAFMRREGVALDAAALGKADAQTQKHIFAKLEDFARDHPMECANTYNALTASGMLVSGLLRRKRGEFHAGNANIANFMFVLAGALSSILIPERTPEQLARNGQEHSIWGAIQQQPLKYAAIPFIGADLSYAGQAYGEYKTAQAMPLNSSERKWTLAMSGISAFTLAAATSADLFLSSSSKKVNGAADELTHAREQLVEFASRTIATQPAETQKALIDKAATYLVRQNGLRMVDVDTQKLATNIMEHIGRYPKAHAEPSTHLG